MDSREVEICIILSSEKESVSLCWGVSYDPEDDPDGPGDNWLFDGTPGESFWENYSDFEPGIAKAKHLIKLDPSLSFRQALFEVFGHFSVTYKVDGNEAELDYNIDGDDVMYSILVEGG